jgi:ubiquinone biosynthesis protein
MFNSILNISEPIAAASIAQVHKAQINDNGTIKDVAIKILRPEIKKIFNDEIDALMFFAFILESIVKKTKRLKLVEVTFLLKQITNHEMDLRFEAAAANEYAENTKNDIGFKVPNIYWNFTSENVMTLDWIDGNSIRETEMLESQNIDTGKIATDIIQHFLRHAVRDGFFHADMHQGNIFIDKSGQIVPIDFGIMGRLDKLSKRFLAEILYGFIQRDYKKVAEVHLAAELVPKNVPVDELAQALRSIGEPIFGQTVKDISGGKLLKQLFDVTEKFNMQTQPQLLLLQKTMVVVEGVARKLNPNTNIWETSRPVLENWLRESKDPINSISETIKDTREVIKKLPEFPEVMEKANQALSFLASGQIPQNSNSYNALNEAKSEMITIRNQTAIGILLLVIFGLLVF